MSIVAGICYTFCMRTTFITGNQKKADYLTELLEFPIAYQKIDLPEIQSFDLEEIVRHKVRAAYDIVQGPVLVEDVALTFDAMGELPGPYIKWFIRELGFEAICRLVDGKSRRCVASCVYGYYDGTIEKYWYSEHAGTVPDQPYDGEAFGWDVIYIPDGYEVTRAKLAKPDE